MKLLALGLVVIAVGGFIFLRRPNSQLAPVPTPTPIPTSILSIVPSSTATPTKNPPAVKSITQTSGPTRGQIICNYQIPATPTDQGVAQIDANWNNATSIAVCLSVNGNTPKLMSQNPDHTGQISLPAPWISLTANYNFILYDQQGNNHYTCAGVILSSCRINTNK
jgi:hypothetical protein